MDLNSWRAFHFLHPLWLLALPPLWALAAWLSTRLRRDGGWAGLIDADLLPALRLSSDGRGRSPVWLLALVWTLAALALSGMTWQRQQSPAFRTSLDWILVLDLSPSMGAADVAPSRIARARYAIADFLSAARDERVALLVFAGEAHTVAPLTTDVETIRALLAPLAPGIMPESGDQLAPALGEVDRLLESSASRHAQVVVLTDGVADPAEALQAAQRLRQRGARVNVVGIGTTSGAPEPDEAGGFLHDAQGQSILTKLPVDQLERIAAAGGGRYVPLSETPTLIAALEQDRARPTGDYETSTGQEVNAWRNGGVWLLPPLLLLVPLMARKGWL
jgi:Ca-activated chloride channel family protein